MRAAKAVVQAVLNSDLLDPDLTRVPAAGALESQIQEEEQLPGRAFSDDYEDLLREWNGLNLDVIRFYGCGRVVAGCSLFCMSWSRTSFSGKQHWA